MKVRIRNPDRELQLQGPKSVREVLTELDIDPDTVLVIREKTLVTREERLEDGDRVEIRPVISGGADRPERARDGRPGERRAPSGGAGR